jgi:hypothetical protein
MSAARSNDDALAQAVSDKAQEVPASAPTIVLMAMQHVLALLQTVQSSATAVDEEEDEAPMVEPADDVDDDAPPPEHPAPISTCMRQALNAAQVPVTQRFSPLTSLLASQGVF